MSAAKKHKAKLPPCPAADKEHTFNAWRTEPNRWFAECRGDKHMLMVRGETEAEVVDTWRCLASPPLAKEIVAVLRELHANEKSIDRMGIWSVELDAAVLVWIAAGRPGLPPETTKKEPKP